MVDDAAKAADKVAKADKKVVDDAAKAAAKADKADKKVVDDAAKAAAKAAREAAKTVIAGGSNQQTIADLQAQIAALQASTASVPVTVTLATSGSSAGSNQAAKVPKPVKKVKARQIEADDPHAHPEDALARKRARCERYKQRS